MTDAEQAILEALVELEQAAASVKAAGPRADLGAILARIDRLAEGLPTGSDPRLKHYLERKSYEKARMHLQALGARTKLEELT